MGAVKIKEREVLRRPAMRWLYGYGLESPYRASFRMNVVFREIVASFKPKDKSPFVARRELNRRGVRSW